MVWFPFFQNTVLRHLISHLIAPAPGGHHSGPAFGLFQRAEGPDENWRMAACNSTNCIRVNHHGRRQNVIQPHRRNAQQTKQRTIRFGFISPPIWHLRYGQHDTKSTPGAPNIKEPKNRRENRIAAIFQHDSIGRLFARTADFALNFGITADDINSPRGALSSSFQYASQSLKRRRGLRRINAKACSRRLCQPMAKITAPKPTNTLSQTKFWR